MGGQQQRGGPARSVRTWIACTLALVVLVASACSGDGGGDADAAALEGSAPPDTSPSTVPAPAATDLRGVRYCELLEVRAVGDALEATVWNTLGLSDCPQAAWEAVDPVAVAEAQGALAVVPNGPRYWLVDTIEKVAPAGGSLPERRQAEVGGLEMFVAATVAISPEQVAGRAPYRETSVDRRTRFTFLAGAEVYELVAPDGAAYVMQSWSQQVDPTLGEADLAGLGDRLELPEGWTYRTRTLDADLVVVTVEEDARVLQDELENSYSRRTDGGS